MRIAALLLIALTAISFAPLAGVFLSTALAGALGCQLDESAVHSCPLGPIDLGEPLAIAFVLGWFMLVTWPGMILSLVGWPVLGVAWLVRRRRLRAG